MEGNLKFEAEKGLGKADVAAEMGGDFSHYSQNMGTCELEGVRELGWGR